MAKFPEKYQEKVRVLWGYAPRRAELMAGASRNRALQMVWRTFLVDMDHSVDNGHFRVRYKDSDAHCLEYCSNEPDAPEQAGMPDSYFEEQCACGIVHDGSEHDCEASYHGVGRVRNVERHRQHEAQLPRTLTDEHNSGGGDDDVDYWSDEDDINLTVLRQSGKMFLVDAHGQNDDLVQAVVFSFSSDGLQRYGTSVKLEYASDSWLRHVHGAEDEEAEDEGAEDEGAEDEGAEDEGAEDEGAEDEGAEDAADAEEAEDADEIDAETAAAEAVADGFWASTPAPSDESDLMEMDEDDEDDEDDADSDYGYCWYEGHSDRILYLLSEWLDRMKREHGLLARAHVFGQPHVQHGEFCRPLPGATRSVAKPEVATPELGPSGRPHRGPNLATLRAREEGRHRPLGGGRQMWSRYITKHKWHTAAPVNACMEQHTNDNAHVNPYSVGRFDIACTNAGTGGLFGGLFGGGQKDSDEREERDELGKDRYGGNDMRSAELARLVTQLTREVRQLREANAALEMRSESLQEENTHLAHRFEDVQEQNTALSSMMGADTTDKSDKHKSDKHKIVSITGAMLPTTDAYHGETRKCNIVPHSEVNGDYLRTAESINGHRVYVKIRGAPVNGNDPGGRVCIWKSPTMPHQWLVAKPQSYPQHMCMAVINVRNTGAHYDLAEVVRLAQERGDKLRVATFDFRHGNEKLKLHYQPDACIRPKNIEAVMADLQADADRYAQRLRFNETTFECGMCQDEKRFTDSMISPCGHVFCKKCYLEWLKNSPHGKDCGCPNGCPVPFRFRYTPYTFPTEMTLRYVEYGNVPGRQGSQVTGS
jgi:hypothetical protein